MLRVVNVRNASVIERIRGKMVYFINSKERDVSNRVIDLVNGRYREISHGVMNTKFEVKPKDFIAENQETKPTAEIEELKRTIEKLMRENESLKVDKADTEDIMVVNAVIGEVTEEVTEQKPTTRKARTKKTE